MSDEVEQPRKAGRPKKQPPKAPFIGFMPEDLNGEYFRTPTVWMLIIADNLAELKVVNYVMRHTCGYIDKKTGEPLFNQAKKISVEEFMNGRKRRNGTRIDWGTKLSDKAVKEGLSRAIEHGFIVCVTDDSDKARIKKYYGLKMQQVEEIEISDEDYEDEVGGITIPSGMNNNPPGREYESPRSKNELLEETLEEKDIRNTHPSENNLENIRYFPEKGERRNGPLFIKLLIEDFSRDCGDADHTVSNITRGYNIYNAAGVDPDAFQEALYAARDDARKATIRKVNSKGRPNRMPYFFKCLEKSLGIEYNKEEVQ
jgi:hypothetical protein